VNEQKTFLKRDHRRAFLRYGASFNWASSGGHLSIVRQIALCFHASAA
jgi:hypothetical protein